MKLFEYYNFKALEQIEEKNIKEAICSLKKSIKHIPSIAEPYIKLYELQEHKDIDLIYKSIEVEPTKWAYFHLFHYYFNKKDFKNLNSSYLEMMNFFEKTNYKPTEEDKNTINSYFGQEPTNDPIKLNFIKNNPIQIKNPLRIIPNHLECVVLLLTGNELENGYYNHFLKQIENTIKDTNKYFSKKLDFKIITNKNEKINTEPLRNLFNSVEIIQSKIPKEYDFYLKHEDEIDGQNLKYGLKSGPNYIFFESFEHLTKYNTTLFLECDCFFGEDWLEKVYNYTRFSGGFWISGAVYDGVNLHRKHTIINEHINGGVALYATGNSLFLEFLQFCWSNFSFFIEQENNLAYDLYIKQIIDDYYNFSSSRELMNFINRQYLFNNLIFNYSTEQEQKTAEQLIRKKYNYSILHKKKILIKIPTYKRPEDLILCINSFLEKQSNNNKIQFVVSANVGDLKTKNIEEVIKNFPNANIFFDNHKNKIQAYNANLEDVDFDIIILASDDMLAIEDCYDQIIIDNMIKFFPNMDGVLWFDTGDNNLRTNTLPIVGINFYRKINPIYNEQYKGYFCDDEFCQIAFKMGKMVRVNQHIIKHNIPHHLSMSENSTYLKSLKYAIEDKATFKIRKKVQFDVPGAQELPQHHKIPSEFVEHKRNQNWGNSWFISDSRYDDPISVMDLYVLEKTDKKVAKMNREEFVIFVKNYFRDFRFSIPNVIHQIWLGGSPPEEIKNMMETFSIGYKQKYPHTRYILWDDEKLKSLNMINQDIFDQEKSYDCKSDIARLEVLNKFGGIYIDSDTIWLGEKSILSLQNQISYGILIAYEKDGTKIGSGYLDSQTTRCANSVFGSTIQNPIIAYLIGKLRESYELNRKHGVVASTGPDFIQSTFDSLKSNLDINILSHKYFYPCWWSKNKKFNPQYDELIKLKQKTTKEICQKYPESILFHCGWEK